MADEKQFYSPSEVAEKFGISVEMLSYWRRTGRIEGIRAGSTTLYTLEQINNADTSTKARGPKKSKKTPTTQDSDGEPSALARAS